MPTTSLPATIAKRIDSGSSNGKPSSIGPHHFVTPRWRCSRRSGTTCAMSSGSSRTSSGIVREEQPACHVLQRLGDLALADAVLLQLAEALVARDQHQQRQGSLRADTGAHPSRALEV